MAALGLANAWVRKGPPRRRDSRWQAAEAVFAIRYTAEHPFRRQLARRLRQQAVTRWHPPSGRVGFTRVFRLY